MVDQNQSKLSKGWRRGIAHIRLRRICCAQSMVIAAIVWLCLLVCSLASIPNRLLAFESLSSSGIGYTYTVVDEGNRYQAKMLVGIPIKWLLIEVDGVCKQPVPGYFPPHQTYETRAVLQQSKTFRVVWHLLFAVIVFSWILASCFIYGACAIKRLLLRAKKQLYQRTGRCVCGYGIGSLVRCPECGLRVDHKE